VVDLAWKPHVLKIGPHVELFEAVPDRIAELQRRVEPWLSTILQSEHLSVLIGSGFSTAICEAANVSALDMALAKYHIPFEDDVNNAAHADAQAAGRGARTSRINSIPL
jgi:hypothetical protein